MALVVATMKKTKRVTGYRLTDPAFLFSLFVLFAATKSKFFPLNT
jgi:hypothetical protein